MACTVGTAVQQMDLPCSAETKHSPLHS